MGGLLSQFVNILHFDVQLQTLFSDRLAYATRFLENVCTTHDADTSCMNHQHIFMFRHMLVCVSIISRGSRARSTVVRIVLMELPQNSKGTNADLGK